MTTTHTTATLEISKEAYDEITSALIKAGNSYRIGLNGSLNMHGLMLIKRSERPKDVDDMFDGSLTYGLPNPERDF